MSWLLTIIACIVFLKVWNKISGDDKKDKELKGQYNKELKRQYNKDYKMKNDNDMSIEISNDYYANDYDDVSEKQTNESVDDSNDDAAETFGY